ncbi:MAG: septum formation inhibitor Maf [Chromatiales bacterium]|nr:septum formation inhibitor Maf [Chromatiales bacterium]
MSAPPRLILGSTSPFRRELLARLHLPFETAAPDIDETRLPDEPPPAYVQRLARLKAEAVAAQTTGEALIIGSDQCAVLGETILGKPHTHERAVAQLRACAGRVVTFHTGLCLLDTRTARTEVDDIRFEVGFRRLSDAEIDNYLRLEQPYNCAGSFKSEALGVALFDHLRGDDPSALVGLPLIRLLAMLRAAGVNPLLPDPPAA